jgi:hypothetical protein
MSVRVNIYLSFSALALYTPHREAYAASGKSLCDWFEQFSNLSAFTFLEGSTDNAQVRDFFRLNYIEDNYTAEETAAVDRDRCVVVVRETSINTFPSPESIDESLPELALSSLRRYAQVGDLCYHMAIV